MASRAEECLIVDLPCEKERTEGGKEKRRRNIFFISRQKTGAFSRVDAKNFPLLCKYACSSSSSVRRIIWIDVRLMVMMITGGGGESFVSFSSSMIFKERLVFIVIRIICTSIEWNMHWQVEAYHSRWQKEVIINCKLIVKERTRAKKNDAVLFSLSLSLFPSVVFSFRKEKLFHRTILVSSCHWLIFSYSKAEKDRWERCV